MIFLDPTSDIAFKKLFGDIAHKNIIISFLNSVLEHGEGEKIVDITMNDPNNLPETPLSKTSIVDIRCTDQSHNQYIVEMQVITQKDYTARAQYYSAPQEAFDILAQSNWSKVELEAYDRYLDSIRSAASQLSTAYDQGVAQGILKGKSEGRLEGVSEGRLREKIDLAKQLLDVLDVQTIANKTGLSVAKVEDLKKNKGKL